MVPRTERSERPGRQHPRTLPLVAQAASIVAVLLGATLGAPDAYAASPAESERLVVSTGCAFSDGVEAARFREETLRWTREAAEQGVASAQFYLARLLWEGNEVPRDRVAALVWFIVAAGTADEDDRSAASAMVRQRSAELLPAEAAEAALRARAWTEKRGLRENQRAKELDSSIVAGRRNPAP